MDATENKLVEMCRRNANMKQICLSHEQDDVKLLKNELRIPHNVWLAIIFGKLTALELLLPYCVCPPLALLLVVPRKTSPQMDVWFQHQEPLEQWFYFFVKYGPVPLGTLAYEKLNTLIINHASIAVQVQFREMHKGRTISLREMCRYRIRLSLGDALSSLPGITLEDLILVLPLPVTLKNYLSSYHQ